MRYFGIVLIVTAATLSSCSKTSGLIGSYIDADYGDGVMMVQIDSVDHRDVHGTVSLATFDNSGVVHSSRVPISGTVEGKALNLSVENGAGTTVLNGTIVPVGLDLTGMGNGHSIRFLFKRKDASEFNLALEKLRTQSAQSQQEGQAAAFKAESAARGVQLQSQINGHIDQLLSDAEAITAKTRQLDNAIVYYQRISARNAQLRATAARLGSDDATGRTADAESRVDGNRNLAANAHDQMRSFWQNVQGQSEANLRRASDFMAECQSNSRLSCSRLASAVAEYSNSVSELRTAVGRETAAYDSQRTRF